MDEEVNKMKMCVLCGFINESELHPNDTWYHKEKGMHKTGNKTWAPIQDHPQYPLHKVWCKLLGLKV